MSNAGTEAGIFLGLRLVSERLGCVSFATTILAGRKHLSGRNWALQLADFLRFNVSYMQRSLDQPSHRSSGTWNRIVISSAEVVFASPFNFTVAPETCSSVAAVGVGGMTYSLRSRNRRYVAYVNLSS
jgi:hypothetical protein